MDCESANRAFHTAFLNDQPSLLLLKQEGTLDRMKEILLIIWNRL